MKQTKVVILRLVHLVQKQILLRGKRCPRNRGITSPPETPSIPQLVLVSLIALLSLSRISPYSSKAGLSFGPVVFVESRNPMARGLTPIHETNSV